MNVNLVEWLAIAPFLAGTGCVSWLNIPCFSKYGVYCRYRFDTIILIDGSMNDALFDWWKLCLDNHGYFCGLWFKTHEKVPANKESLIKSYTISVFAYVEIF